MLYFIAAIYGLIIGNYLTSAYFRIPRNIPLNGLNNKIGKKPHCSACGHKLKFYEYFPVLNWFSTRMKCNYCHAKIDIFYMMIEIFMTIIAIILLSFMGMTSNFVIAVLFAASALLNIALFMQYKIFYVKAIVALLFLGVTLVIFGKLNFF